MAARRGRRAKAKLDGVGSIEIAQELPSDGERLFLKAAEQALHGHRALVDGLTPHEKQLVLQWLATAICDGNAENQMHDVLWEIDFKEKPPSIEQFLENDEYLGRTAAELEDKWKEDLAKVFAPKSLIFEWVMTGGIGIGKTTIAMIAMAYKLAWVLCLRDHARYYGLGPNTLMVLGIYSRTKAQVGEAGFYKIRDAVDSSPWFRSHHPRDRSIDSMLRYGRAKRSGSTKRNDIHATGKIQVIPGSQDYHALGLDMFAFAMDEVNFMQAKENKEAGQMQGQAHDLYNATYKRLTSRYMRPGGSVPGLMLLMSSRKAQTDFLETHLKEVRDRPSTYVSDYALWEVKPKSLYTLPKIRVEVGDRIASSRILQKDQVEREGSRVIEFPGEYELQILEDVDGALRDIAGVATFGVTPLIRDRKSVYDAIHDQRAHPFTKESIVLDIVDDVRIDEFFDLKSVCFTRGSRWVPRINPGHPRFIHGDLSLTQDCLGLSMGHVAGTVRNARTNADGTISEVVNPFIIIDFMLRVVPPVNSEIDLGKVRGFILYLARLFQVARVTFDRFQSAEMIQLLGKMKIEAGHQSVDKTDEAYKMLRSALFDRRVLYYEYEPFIEEVLDVEHNPKKRKVDHPVKSSKGGKGSKDVSDAAAGVIWLCTTDERARDTVELPEFEPQRKPLAVEDVHAAAAGKAGTLAGIPASWDELRSNV